MDLKKVFISHSSSDKEHYVRPLVNRLLKTLGEDKLVYDELTFDQVLDQKLGVIDRKSVV